MKFAQYAFCGIFLTLTAAAQTANPPSAPASTTPATMSARPPQLSTLGGDTVKGPEHPLTADQAKALYEAMGYQKWLDQNRATMITGAKARNPMLPVSFWDDLDTSFAKIDYQTMVFDSYKKYLSTEDATKLIEFSKTEAGKHYFESIPPTSQELLQAMQSEQNKIGRETQMRHKDEIQAAVKKYQEEHAPKPAPSLGPTTPSGSTPPANPSATPANPSTSPSPSPSATPTPPASTTPHN